MEVEGRREAVVRIDRGLDHDRDQGRGLGQEIEYGINGEIGRDTMMILKIGMRGGGEESRITVLGTVYQTLWKLSQSKSTPTAPQTFEITTREWEMIPLHEVRLITYSRAMHSTLLSTTSQALALQNLKRLETFPQELINVESLNNAKLRFRQFETELSGCMKDLHQTFTEVMKRASPLSSLGRASGSDMDHNSNKLSSRLDERDRSDRDRDVDRKIRDKVDFSELVTVRKRVEGLERRFEEGEFMVNSSTSDIKGKGKGKDIPPHLATPDSDAPPDGDISTMTTTNQAGANNKEPGVEGKRSRARELLKDMLDRLEKVEGMKEGFDNRCTNLEDALYSKEQEEYEIMRLGNGKWKILEELRDPDGVIRGVKRRKMDEEVTDDLLKAVEMIEDGSSSKPSGGQLQGTIIPPEPVSAGPPQDTSTAMVRILKDQVEALKKELEGVKSSQTYREKEIISQVTSTLREELTLFCKDVSCDPYHSSFEIKECISVLSTCTADHISLFISLSSKPSTLFDHQEDQPRWGQRQLRSDHPLFPTKDFYRVRVFHHTSNHSHRLGHLPRRTFIIPDRRPTATWDKGKGNRKDTIASVLVLEYSIRRRLRSNINYHLHPGPPHILLESHPHLTNLLLIQE